MSRRKKSTDASKRKASILTRLYGRSGSHKSRVVGAEVLDSLSDSSAEDREKVDMIVGAVAVLILFIVVTALQ